MVVKVDGKELKTKNGKNGRAGWISKSEDEKFKYQELTLYSGDAGDCMNDGRMVGWQLYRNDLKKWRLRSRLPRQPSGRKHKFMVPDEIREMAAAAANQERLKGIDGKGMISKCVWVMKKKQCVCGFSLFSQELCQRAA